MKTCDINLSPATRISDVADVIGILLGCEKQLNRFAGESSLQAYVVVYGITILVWGTQPNMATITIEGADGVFDYNFEGSNGTRFLTLDSSAKNIALGMQLVCFFGGSIDYNDHDDTLIDFEQPTPGDIQSGDDDAYESRQRRKMALTPLTNEDYARYEKYAANSDSASTRKDGEA